MTGTGDTERPAGSLSPGNPGWRSFSGALFLAGFATFALIFAPQAFLPALSAELGVAAGAAAVTVSATTLGVAVGVLAWAGISDRIGRVRAMRVSLLLALVPAVALPFLPNLDLIVAVRFAQGLLLGAAPAVGMAAIAERVSGRWAAHAAGTFVAGNTIGGIVGRLTAGFAADHGGWRVAFGTSTTLATMSVLAFLVVARRLRAVAPPVVRATSWTGVSVNLRDRAMLALYAQGFLLMGSFGVVYNLFGYRLQAPPFLLSASLTSSVFVVYLAGTVASRRSGAIAHRLGTTGALIAGSALMLFSLPVMLVPSVPVMVAGLVVFTVGCFTAHPLASGLSGRTARSGRSQATALYQISWLGGTSLFGWLGGVVYAAAGWPAALLLVAVLCVLAAGAAAARSRAFTQPSPQGRGPGGTG